MWSLYIAKVQIQWKIGIGFWPESVHYSCLWRPNKHVNHLVNQKYEYLRWCAFFFFFSRGDLDRLASVVFPRPAALPGYQSVCHRAKCFRHRGINATVLATYRCLATGDSWFIIYSNNWQKHAWRLKIVRSKKKNHLCSATRVAWFFFFL